MEKLKNRKERFEYQGKLADYQLIKSNTYMEYEKDNYSNYQNYLYKRALYGLSIFSQNELATMCSKKKQRINNVYLKAQNIINLYKQKLTKVYTDSIFTTLFPNSPITDYLLNDESEDVKFKNKLTFKELNISKDDIINLFVNEGVLPKNFFALEISPNALPRLKSNGRK